jgi:hypothetical protein
MGDSTVQDYIIRSKLTGAGRNGIQGSAEFWDYLAAHKGLSIFWTFLSDEVYFDKSAFSDKVKIGILAVNVWFFFVRKNCLWQCLDNLMQTGNGLTDKRLLIEMLVIQYMSGIILMPGAHGQF